MKPINRRTFLQSSALAAPVVVGGAGGMAMADEEPGKADRKPGLAGETYRLIRVQPAASMMGQAAGAAAVQALATSQPACDLDTAALVASLRRQGAYLPQTELRKTMTR